MMNSRTDELQPSTNAPGLAATVGVLLVNLGTPDSLALGDIRKYLREFLSDRRVIDYHPIFWQPILRGIILNTRPRKTQRAYQKIWRQETNESPLRYFTRGQAETLRRAYAGKDLIIEWAMNYGNPSIDSVLKSMTVKGCHRILVIPLYPQYSATTTASVADRVFRALQQMRWQPALRTLDTWHDDEAYIQATVLHVNAHLDSLAALPERLLLSFHGLPQRYVDAGDPYHDFCLETARLIEAHLGRPDLKVMTSFQSRFGPGKWLQPATDTSIAELAATGIKSVAVYSPGFVADCVETLEEIGVQAKQSFVKGGGEEFVLIPCLNDSTQSTAMLTTLIDRELSGWL